MTNRTMTLTVTMNPDGTLAVDSANQGMPLNKIGEGMVLALEGMILGTITQRLGIEPDDETRKLFAQPIRLQTQQMLDATPNVADSGRQGLLVTIPAGVEDVDD